MFFKRISIPVLALCFFVAGACEPQWFDLTIVNNSDLTLSSWVNIAYPDTTFERARICGHVKPHSSSYICTDLDLKVRNDEGLTVFLFEYHGPTNFPDNILKKWILLRSDLDSLDWTLSYP